MAQFRSIYYRINMKRFLTLTLIAVYFKTTFSAKCNSFENVKVKVFPSGDFTPYYMNITGCIERPVFEHTINQVHVKNQVVPRLGRDSIRNMKHLHGVVFENSVIRVIEVGAFRNVPNLESIKIIYSDLEVVPAEVFSKVPKLKSLFLSHNKLRHVADEGFGNVETLERLYCDHNNLRNWKRAWFTNSTSLIIMDFSFNKIKILPRRAFYDFFKLKEIYFDYNELEVIESEAFKDVTNLDSLSLKYNRLKSIHPRVFPNDIDITVLSLSANYLSFISKKIMVLVSVREMGIDGNPWKCPCLDQVLFWLYNMNATVSKSNVCMREDVPVCSFPEAFSRTCREVVEDDVVRTYLDELRKIDPPLENYCARLD